MAGTQWQIPAKFRAVGCCQEPSAQLEIGVSRLRAAGGRTGPPEFLATARSIAQLHGIRLAAQLLPPARRSPPSRVLRSPSPGHHLSVPPRPARPPGTDTPAPSPFPGQALVSPGPPLSLAVTQQGAAPALPSLQGQRSSTRGHAVPCHRPGGGCHSPAPLPRGQPRRWGRCQPAAEEPEEGTRHF